MAGNRVPHEMGTCNFCAYKDDGSPVLMGDAVTVVVRAYDCSEREESGRLCSVRYGEDGLIEGVSLLHPETVDRLEEEREVPCDGVFYRMVAGDGMS